MNFHIYKTKEELSDKLALWICDLINATLQNQEFFTLVLSGGETPKNLFKKLATEYQEKINWTKVHFFWGDERVVSATDERNNAKMAYDILIDHLEIPASQIHVMRTDIEPVFAADEYEKTLHHFFDNTVNSFDLVLLGMGDDGHTLSLFPNSLLLNEEKKSWVEAVYHEAQNMYRITLMPLIVNRASHIAFMIDGKKKSGVLKKVIEGPYNPLFLPAQIIQPKSGQLHWFLDEDAAKDLNKNN
ncbi:6-phosphogluconolactonase [Ginsengibacter hankyongi]|uniref:6-phosphogluconolactonase n=1 Tax=Ginsengibacter hankyongi TaxID=2607284 RepID=A0A5J5IPI2_9BACT|nr:6-phosphogluconolactonase [Ginsengibacter hankyongi]KAA9041927.1 6-phosphogluconolactonase [Ginsengibacter hankyongi]